MSIHEYETKLEKTVNSIINDPTINERNKQILLHFRKDLDLGKVTRQISVGRIYKYIWMVKIFLRMINKPMDKFTNADLEDVVQNIDKNIKWKATTKYDLKVCLKTLVRWLNKNYKSKKSQLDVSWLKLDKTRLTKLPEELITQDEIHTLINACPSKRDRAFVGILFESGARVGEILNMNVRHCVFDEYGAIIIVKDITI